MDVINMDIKKLYSDIGGDYDTALNRLMMDSLIEKMVLKFNQTDYISSLEDAVNNFDLDNVFFHAHSLKGVALNLSFLKLSEATVVLTDYVRGENKNLVDRNILKQYFSNVLKQYLIVKEVINKAITGE